MSEGLPHFLVRSVAAAVSKGLAHDNPASGGRPHTTESQWELRQSAVDEDRIRKGVG